MRKFFRNFDMQLLVASILLACMIVPLFLDLGNVNPQKLKSSDIYFIWKDGEDISQGLNPYSRIHGSDMRQNHKYSTYLPGFFLIEALTIKLGVTSFDDFVSYWSVVVTILFAAIGVIIFAGVFERSKSLVLGLFCAFMWLLSRWNLPTLRTWQIDFVAIAFLLLAYLLLNQRRYTGLILLGCSLAIKQIAVFALPLFIIHIFIRTFPQRRALQNFSINLALIFLVPFLVSLPFLIWDAPGFFKSIFFSVTRNPGGLKLESIDQVFGFVGLPAKIPLLFALLPVYWMYWKKYISLSQGILLSFLCFVSFNSVIFKQYLPWCSAFLGMALADLVLANRSKKAFNG